VRMVLFKVFGVSTRSGAITSVGARPAASVVWHLGPLTTFPFFPRGESSAREG
jgi:hypothetical protein